MTPKALIVKVCKQDWVTRSGYGPTVIDGRKFRPVSWHGNEVARCYFCGESKAGAYHYYEVTR